MYKHEIEERLNRYAPTTKWEQGVKDTALDLIENLEIDDDVMDDDVEYRLLNNACSWDEYSWGGSPLAYDADIIQRYCDDSTADYVFDHYNEIDTLWPDVQARGLEQAASLIYSIVALGY